METWFKTGLLLTITIIVSSAALGFAGGNGTPSTPYQIQTCQQLQDMQENLTATYELTSNIDCEGINFNPVGSASNGFKGYLDGNGHAIKNLEIDKPSQDKVGLFALLEGRIHNIKLLNADVNGENDVGVIAGKTNPLSLTDEIVGAVKLRSSNVTGNTNVGGLIGNATGGKDEFSDITDVEQTGGTITTTGNNPRNIGGMIGANIRDLRFSDATDVTVHAPDATNVGGLIGKTSESNHNYLFFTGNVTGDYRVGGITGLSNEPSSADIFASGNIRGNTSVGGIVGVNKGDNEFDSMAGYSLSNVTGVNKIGGIFGNSTVKGFEGYAAGNVTGQTNVSGIGHGEGITFGTDAEVSNVVDRTTQSQSFSSQETNINNITASFLKTRSQNNNITDYVGFLTQITEEDLYVTQDGLPINGDLEISQQVASQNIASPTSISSNTSRILGKDDKIIDFNDRRTYRLPEEDINSISSTTVTDNGTIYVGVDVFEENASSLYKFDSNFNIIWKQNLSSSCKGQTQNPVAPEDMVLTEQDNLIIQDDNEGGTKKINSDGTTEWTYCGGHTDFYRANKIALDTNGNVVAADDGFESAIVKINSTTGTKIWNNTLEGQSGNTLDVGPDNKIYYSGDEILKIANKTGHTKDRIRVSGQGSAKNVRAKNDYIVISTTEALYKYDPDTGGLVWRSEAMRYEDTGFNNYNPLAIDKKGRIFAGALQGDTDNPYSTGALMKVSKTGEVLDEIEQKQYKPNVQNEFDYPELNDIDISDNGEHLIIASTVQSDFDKGPQLIKLDTQQPTPASVYENKENNLTILERLNDPVYSFGKSTLNRTTKGTAIGDTNSDGKIEVISFNGTSLNTFNSTGQTGTLTGQYDLPRNSSTTRLGELDTEPDTRSDVLFRNQEDRIAFIDGNSSNTAPLGLDGFTNSPIITFQDPNGNSKYIFNNESTVDAPTSLPEVRSELKDIDDDGRLETAYEDAGTLKIIDKEGNNESLATASIPSTNSKLAVDDIDDDGLTEVIYPNVNDNNYMYQVDINDNSPTRITATTGSKSSAIIGYSDFNNDGDKEIVFQGTSQTIKWLESGTVQSTGYSSIGANQGVGLGPVADYNNTGTARVPIVDGSNQLAMIDNQGNKEILTTGAAKTTLGAYDIQGDNRDEIFYRNTNGKLATYNFNGTTSLYTTSQGNTVNGNRIISIGIGVPIRSHNPVDMGDFDTDGYEEVVYVSGVAKPHIFNYETNDNDPVSQKISDTSITRNLHSGIVRDIDSDNRPEILYPNQSTGVQAIDHTGQITTITSKITGFAGCTSPVQCTRQESGQVVSPIDWTGDNTAEIAIVRENGNITIYNPTTDKLIETDLKTDTEDPDLSTTIKPQINTIDAIRSKYSNPAFSEDFLQTDYINTTARTIDIEGSTDVTNTSSKVYYQNTVLNLDTNQSANYRQANISSRFKPTTDGIWIVEYNITDEHGLSTSRTRTINVEDNKLEQTQTVENLDNNLLTADNTRNKDDTINSITNTLTSTNLDRNKLELQTIQDGKETIIDTARSFANDLSIATNIGQTRLFSRTETQPTVVQDNIQFTDTYTGSYNSTTYRFSSPQTWKKINVNSDIIPSNHSVTLTYRAIDQYDTLQGSQTFNLQDGSNNYSLTLPSTRKASYTIQGETTSFNSWNVSEVKVYSDSSSVSVGNTLIKALGGQFALLDQTIDINDTKTTELDKISNEFTQTASVIDTTIRQLILDRNQSLTTSIADTFNSIFNPEREQNQPTQITDNADRNTALERTTTNTPNVIQTATRNLVLNRENTETTYLTDLVINREIILNRNPLLNIGISDSANRTTSINRNTDEIVEISQSTAETVLFPQDAFESVTVFENVERQISSGRSLINAVNADDNLDRTIDISKAIASNLPILDRSTSTLESNRETDQPVTIVESSNQTPTFVSTINQNIELFDLTGERITVFRSNEQGINTSNQATSTSTIARSFLDILPINTTITSNSKPVIDNVEVDVDRLGDDKQVKLDVKVRDPDGLQNLDKIQFNGEKATTILQTGVQQTKVRIDITNTLSQSGTLTLIDNAGSTDQVDVGFDISDNEYFGTGDADQQTLNKEDTITMVNASQPIDYNITHLIYPETDNIISGGTHTGTLDKGQTDNINTTIEGDYIQVNRTIDQVPNPERDECRPEATDSPLTGDECPDQEISTVDKQYIQEEVTIDNFHNAELEIFLPEPSIPRGFGPNATNFDDRTVTFTKNYINNQLNTDSGDAIGATFDSDVTDVNIGERETYFEQYEYVSNTPLDLKVEHQVTVNDTRYSYGSFLEFSKNNTEFNRGTFDVQQTNTCDDTLPRLSEASFYNQTWNGCAEDNNGNLIPELFTSRLHINGDGTTYVRYGGFKGEPPEEAIKPFEGLKPCQPLGTEYEKQDGTTLKCYDPPSCDVDDTPTAAIGERKSISCSTQDQDGIQDNVYLLKRDIIREEVDRSAQMVQIFEGIGFAASVLLLTSTIIYRKEYNKYPPGIEAVAKQVRNL